MECILFRHGIAVPCEDWNGQESQRPLTQEGIKKTRKAAEGLLQLGLKPTHLLSSPFTRAIQTAKLLNEAFEIKKEIPTYDELLSGAHPEKIIPVLHTFSSESCVICVGHEPHLGNLAAVMLGARTLGGFSLKKAGACSIGLEDGIRPGRGHLIWWLTPAQLRQLRKGA